MQKINIKELVDFRRKATDKARKNFADKLKTRTKKEKKEEDKNPGGGNYWVTSTSAIYNVFKHNKTHYYEEKINELVTKHAATKDKKVKAMYQRNTDILNNFKDFNFSEFRPAKIAKFETVQRVHTLMEVSGLPLYITPDLLFVHERKGKTEIGAIWLVAQINGFKKNELGMFCEMLHQFLHKHFAEHYQISDDLCIAIDTFSAQKVTYQELINKDIPFLIEKTLKEIKDL